MEKELKQFIDKIEGLDVVAMEEAESRQEQLAKPTGALGVLEELSIQLAGITGNVKNKMDKQAIVVMSADNGVVEEGVASAPQSVTYSQTINFTRGLTGVGSLAKYYDIDLLVVDCGVKMNLPKDLLVASPVENGELTKKIVDRRMAPGTNNLAVEPAMIREQAIASIITGIECAKAIKYTGHDIFGVGEMGIGNTTTSACILSALTGASGNEVVGRGGGLNDAGLMKKIDIVNRASQRAVMESEDVIDILAQVGGFDICAMVGAYLGAAVYKIPVVIDGYISAVAALAATKIEPKCKAYMIGSHESTEPGYLIAMKYLGLTPLFNLKMRLGEGSGCPISFKIVEAACATMNLMATFEEGAIDADYLEEGKEGNFF
ncbi:MAG: nicotinate-nucleotide--dimethylbenzimidazole phosphoribosyltransferase [Clostridia bacterium]|nr:nicotinate-nucleotide--dimethylbenzimidazole phosphoribosyltransferase [Clostridia bacterium]